MRMIPEGTVPGLQDASSQRNDSSGSVHGPAEHLLCHASGRDEGLALCTRLEEELVPAGIEIGDGVLARDAPVLQTRDPL